MALPKTIEAQAGNGNGNERKEAGVNPVGKIFCGLGVALTRMVADTASEALTGVDKTARSDLSNEEALGFAEAVTARVTTETLWQVLYQSPQGPLTPRLMVAVSGARRETDNLLDEYYSVPGANEQQLAKLAAAIRRQISLGHSET